MDIYLRFKDQAAAEAALIAEGFHVDDGAVWHDSESIDAVGTMYSAAGEGDDVVFTPVAGYHVNIRTELNMDSLDDFRVYPVTPSRLWAEL